MTESKADKKTAAAVSYRSQLQALRTLDAEEIGDLVHLEIYETDPTIPQQARRWYLRVKTEHPDRAAIMQTSLAPILEKGVTTESDVLALVAVIRGYVNGFLIYFGGKLYS